MINQTAKQLDANDTLAKFKEQFELPTGIYFVGNSLGAQPKAAREYVNTELDRWATLGVEGHFTGRLAWRDYHELLTEQLARLVGALPKEVVAMNALTVNLHLMMVSFYRPTKARHKILIEEHAFPSDHFAVESQIRERGFDPATSLMTIAPRPGESALRSEDIIQTITEHGDELALILLPGVQYFTGQVLPMAEIAKTGHQVGAMVGLDLAHAAGNIPLALHEWNIDFAVWCTYKYLNSGPGGVGAAFVHERHVSNKDLPKFLGWWGTSVATRFKMNNIFEPISTVESWQLSNAPILPMALLRSSLDIFDAAGGMSILRKKSEQQIALMDRLLNERLAGRVMSLTPSRIEERGCQFALRVTTGDSKQVFEALTSAKVFCDWREPNVIRIAPVPLYNSFAEIEQFINIFADIMDKLNR